MEEAYEACRTIINDNRDKLDAIAQALIDRETLTSDELKTIVFGNEPPQIEQPPVEEPPPVIVELSKPTEVEQPKISDDSSPTTV
jgi:cell division protease FtsH